MTTNLERLMTVADLDAMPDDGNLYELIGGVLFMSRAPSIPHQRVLLNLILKSRHIWLGIQVGSCCRVLV